MGKLLILFITLFSFIIKSALSSWVPLKKGTGSIGKIKNLQLEI